MSDLVRCIEKDQQAILTYKKGQFTALSAADILSRIPSYLTLDISTYSKTNVKARFIDSEYGEFWAMPYAVFRGSGHYLRGLKNNKQSKIMSLSELKSRLPGHITVIEDTYISASKKCKFIDSEYGEFSTRPTHILQGRSDHPTRLRLKYIHPMQKLYIGGITAKEWCKKHNLPYSSAKALWHKGEDFLIQWKNNYNTSRSTLEVFVSNKLGLNPYNRYPLDSLKYKPDFKLNKSIYMNVDGLYWHGDKHKDKNYHYNLRKEFQNHKKLIFQFTSDQVLFDWNKVESIISAKTGSIKIKYYARKLEMKDVDNKEAQEFLKTNHLMGEFRSAKHIGLYAQDQLVSLISYKKYKEGIDISRFCNALNSSVAGGLSKLLKEIERREQPKFIQSWVDLRYGTGDSLKSIGFQHKRTTLGWKWTDGHHTFNRLKCRANMDSRRLTEKQHAEELGWYRIYDAGQALYIKEL